MTDFTGLSTGESLAVIAAGAGFLAMMVYPMGKDTSLTSDPDKPPQTWAQWRDEARLSLWAANPLKIWGDVLKGYADVTDGMLGTLTAAVWVAGTATAAIVTGFGVLSLLF